MHTSQKLDETAELVTLDQQNSMPGKKVLDLEVKLDEMSENSARESVVSALLLENCIFKEKLSKNECHSLSNNLVFIGVTEQKSESCDRSI